MKIWTSIAGKSVKSKEAGFTYVIVLVGIVVVGLLAGIGTQMNSYLLKRDREEELLFRGLAYKRAIRHYYKDTGTFPKSLEELVQSTRFRHKPYLRTLYPDPMSRGTQEWRLLRSLDGGITGVSSASEGVPLKRANFPRELESFEAAQSYSDWVFEYVPETTPGAQPSWSPVPAQPPVLHTN